MTPLHVAVISGGRQEVELLLDKKADISLKSESGQTVLHLSAATGQPRLTKFPDRTRRRCESQGQGRQNTAVLCHPEQAPADGGGSSAIHPQGMSETVIARGRRRPHPPPGMSA